MKYFLLFLPILVSFIVTGVFGLSGNANEQTRIIIGSITLGATLLIYLRWYNDSKYLVNILSIVLLAIIIGQYLMNSGFLYGSLLYQVASIFFLVLYGIRAKNTESKSSMQKYKILAVGIYCIGNIVYANIFPIIAPLMIGYLALSIAYFNDRILKIKIEQTTTNIL